jgi:hypothetical protein
MTTYRTPDEIDDRATQCETEATLLPPGPARDLILKEAQQLRVYSGMKRLLEIPKQTRDNFPDHRVAVRSAR